MFPPQADVDVEKELRGMARKAMLVRAEEVGEALVQIYRACRLELPAVAAYRETLKDWLNFLERLEQRIGDAVADETHPGERSGKEGKHEPA